MNLKWLFRVFTTKDWRGHKRRMFLEKVFEYLKEDRMDGVEYENFSFIRDSNSSYEKSCHEMAATYNYNPIVDSSYELNIGKFFSMYNSQPFDSLYARIERKTRIWKILTKRNGVYIIHISGKENGNSFKFSYRRFIEKVF
jgi:hypothetical protein